MKPAKIKNEGRSFSLFPLDNQRLALLLGERDTYLKQIETHCDVKISHRAEVFYIDGYDDDAAHAEKVIRNLYALSATDSNLDAKAVHLALMEGEQIQQFSAAADKVIKVRNHQISPRNAAQGRYIAQITANDVCFGIGPAGTGKTYLSVVCAAQALANKDVERIVLVRPVVEAGEKLGFLPGDISQKVDPYLRPLYDALYEMLGVERVGKLIERGVIELAPLAYMRGRTLHDAFVLLDEAQNTTIEQMKMFLTRMGQGSKMVITGDVTQIDLPRHLPSGLLHVQSVLANVSGVGFAQFSAKDVVRHTLVQRIVEAYEAKASSAAQSSVAKDTSPREPGDTP